MGRRKARTGGAARAEGQRGDVLVPTLTTRGTAAYPPPVLRWTAERLGHPYRAGMRKGGRPPRGRLAAHSGAYSVREGHPRPAGRAVDEEEREARTGYSRRALDDPDAEPCGPEETDAAERYEAVLKALGASVYAGRSRFARLPAPAPRCSREGAACSV